MAPSPSPDDRARELLRAWMERRGTTVAEIARSLGRPRGDVEGWLFGGEPLSLERVEEVLAAIGVAPEEFFARLYRRGPAEAGAVGAAGPEPAGGEDGALGRQEVEELVEEARTLIREALGEGGEGGG